MTSTYNRTISQPNKQPIKQKHYLFEGKTEESEEIPKYFNIFIETLYIVASIICWNKEFSQLVLQWNVSHISGFFFSV